MCFCDCVSCACVCARAHAFELVHTRVVSKLACVKETVVRHVFYQKRRVTVCACARVCVCVCVLSLCIHEL